MKKKLLGLLVTVSAFTAIVSSVSAQSLITGGVSGGWSEDTGYFVINNTNKTNTFAVASASSSQPDSHKATVDSRSAGTGVSERRITAKTVWTGKYHYTRARFEEIIGSGTVGDTDRVWGNDTTTAITPWCGTDLMVAKSYWGS